MQELSVTRRQLVRRRQRGQLNKSTLVALALVALACVAGSEWQLLRDGAEKLQTRGVAWAAQQGFVVQRVDVTGRRQVSSQFMLQALQAKQGMPIFEYCPQDAAARLAENPWFKTVNVERRLPDTVFVRVEERIPAARWQVQGKLAVVDVEGVVLTTENLDAYKDLPIIIGQEARHKVVDLFALLRGEPELSQQVAAASWVANRRWDLTLRNGIVVKLPASDASQALSAFALLEKQQKILDRDITVVDLRLPQRAVLRPTVRANVLIERPDFSDNPSAKKAI